MEKHTESYIVLVTRDGLILKFKSKDLQAKSRGCQGIKAIKTMGDDHVIAAFPVVETY